MIMMGVDLINPSAYSIHYFGANFGPDIIKGEYWRLLTSNYIHIGLMHLLFNMWCLHSIGLELEELIGSKFFFFVYTLSGISGSICSCFINYNSIGAGASGAVFGISGALLIMVYYLNQTSNSNIQYNYSPLLFFIMYNTFFGFVVPGIDNAAHIGGLIIGMFSGLIIGKLYLK
tara:strand:+ start:1090 stop:1611 length:522 start_codon:yes stop_codon:yes gene_type:complete